MNGRNISESSPDPSHCTSHSDSGKYGEDLDRAGDMDLLAEISERVRPLHHMFGHTHHGYGFSADGTTRFVNASICDGTYYPSQPPMCFDLPSRERFG